MPDKDDSTSHHTTSTGHHTDRHIDHPTTAHSQHAGEHAHAHTTVATVPHLIPRHEKTTWAKCKHPTEHHPHPVTHTTSTKSKIPRHEKTTWAKCKNPKEHHPHHAHGEHKSIPRHEKKTWAKCKHPEQHHSSGTVVERHYNAPVIVEHHHEHVTEVIHPSVERQHQTVEVQQVAQPVYEHVSGKHKEEYGGKKIKVAEKFESDAAARAEMEKNRKHLAAQANVTSSQSYDKKYDSTKLHDVAVGHKVIQEVTPVVHRDVSHEKVVHKDEKLIEKIHHAPEVHLHHPGGKPTDPTTH